MHNGRVAEKYGQCSSEHHQLELFFNPRVRQIISDYVAAVQIRPHRGEHGCIKPQSATKRFSARCPHCDTMVSKIVRVSRVVAIAHEPPENYWKAVIKRRGGGPSDYVFQGSARCILYQDKEHCVRFEHVIFETYRQNAVRQGHQSGRYGCWCPESCLGESVRHHCLTRYEMEKGQAKGVVPV